MATIVSGSDPAVLSQTLSQIRSQILSQLLSQLRSQRAEEEEEQRVGPLSHFASVGTDVRVCLFALWYVGLFIY